jgi:hypothetical protein
MICTAMTTFNDVIDDQPATNPAAGRAAAQSRASITIPFEHDRTHALPDLRAIIWIVHLWSLVWSGLPSWWPERRRFHRHACALPWAFCF